MLAGGFALWACVPEACSARMNRRATSFLSVAPRAQFFALLAPLLEPLVTVNRMFGLVEPAWAITACVYGLGVTATGVVSRMRRRFSVHHVIPLCPLAILRDGVTQHADQSSRRGKRKSGLLVE